nr:hypothetical protein [Saprospiraceae bacterium]
MKKKNTFLQRLPFLMMALLLAATIGCGDDDNNPTTCTKDVDLGLYTVNFEVPYEPDFELLDIVSEEDTTGLVSVNHPLDFEFLQLSQTTTTTEVFDCEAFNTAEKYTWRVASQQTLLTVVLGDNNSSSILMIKETPLVDDTKPQDGPIGNFLEFYHEDGFSGLLKDSPFMRVMTLELQAGKGSGYEQGFTLLDSITIKGETYEQVYTNTESLTGKVR